MRLARLLARLKRAGWSPAAQQIDRNLQEALRAEFDPDFYRNQDPALAGSDAELLAHYLKRGWRENRDPSADFSTEYYLQTYPDVAASGINPWLHYIGAGRAEARKPKGAVIRMNQFGVQAAEAAALDAVRDAFDAGYYRATNPGIAGDDAALLEHFMSLGWTEGRDPRSDFSTRFYLETYDDIAAGGMNPFRHYRAHGRHEGRRARGDGPVRLVQTVGAVTVAPYLRALVMRPGPDQRPLAPARVNAAAMDIHWIVPDFARGAGGHMTIFRMVRLMEQAGHRVKIWIERASGHPTADTAFDDIVKYFQCVAAEVDFLENGFFAASGDVLIATGWSTAYPARLATGFAAKFYFVQDHEPEFYPTGTDKYLAEQSYSFDLACLCASPWLAQKMQEKGRWARAFHLAYEHDIYRILDPDLHGDRFDPDNGGSVKIAVYARDHTARRCVQLALMALDQLGARGADIEVHFFGQRDMAIHSASFAAVNHGVLDSAELAALYNDCHLGICFSATNYSLVPQEMMACGLPVLEFDTESTRAIFPPGVVTFAGPDPDDIAAKLTALIADPVARAQQMRAALAWVEGFTWEGEALKVIAAIVEYLGDKGLAALAAPMVQSPREHLLDVVIPTFNGLAEVQPVIAALRRQQHAPGMQIFCVDSSSIDGTTDWLRAQADISLTVIAQAEFQHGRTRNLAASLGRAPLIAMLTQDAVPLGVAWAYDIGRMFGHYPRAAGLFGRHQPYPHHPATVRDEITSMFQAMLKHPLCLSMATDPARWADPADDGWRKLLHFYSDNNSAMRRAIWQDIPYPEIDYGEDQVWAQSIILAGHAKLYAPTVAVLHSHDYGPVETYARAMTEAGFFHRHFGYGLGDGTETQHENRIRAEQAAFRLKAEYGGMRAEEVALRLENIAAKHRGWRAGRLAAQG